MPDILDDLRAELDSAFERAEDANGVHRHRRRWSKSVRHSGARGASAPDAAVHVRELPPAHGGPVGSLGAHRRFRGLIIMGAVAAAAVAFVVFVEAGLNRESIPADERAAPSQTTTPVSPSPPRTEPSLTEGSFNRYGPVDAKVYARSPGAWDRQVTINKGLDDGVHRGDPVIDGAGLVGTVAKSTGGSSVVTLITDPSFGTSVYVGQGRHPGSITTAIGPSGNLLFEPVDAGASVRENDLVYTAGTTDPALKSRYPRAVPVGRVSRIDLGDGDLDRRIYVRPAADLLRLDVVQVLTDPHTS